MSNSLIVFLIVIHSLRILAQRRSCSAIDPPANGAQSGVCREGSPFGALCTFTCSTGFRLTGTATATCQPSGLWGSATPTCTRVACGNLVAPANGVARGTCSPGATASNCFFSCLGGFVLNGSVVATCRADGTWSSVAPQCLQTVAGRSYVNTGCRQQCG